MLSDFNNLAELMIAFQGPQKAVDHFTAIRWRNGQFCPYCGHDKIYTLSGSKTKKNAYSCAQCRTSFSITVGTIFENTKLPLRVWFGAIWLITNHPKGIASTTLAKDLGISQRAAWFVLHRLRYAIRTGSFNKPLTGEVEVDETFVGGKAKNKHGGRSGKGSGSGKKTKIAIIGAVERKGGIVARVIPSLSQRELNEFVYDVVSPHIRSLHHKPLDIGFCPTGQRSRAGEL